MKAFHPRMREDYKNFCIGLPINEQFVKDNPAVIARRLSKARSMTLDNVYRRTSSSSRPTIEKQISKSEQHTDTYIHPSEEQSSIFPDRIKKWMLNVDFNAREKRKSTHSSDTPSRSPTENDIAEIEYDPFSDTEETTEFIPDRLPVELQKEVRLSDSILCDVKWELEKCDILIEVEDALLPVQKNLLSYVSRVFRSIMDGCLDLLNNHTRTVRMQNHTFNEVKTILEYIYAVSEDTITDENVASLLQLGDEFKVERLIFQCEQYLHASNTFNPFIMSHLAKQYHLTSLLEYSYSEMSKIDNIEETQEFQLLDSVAQNQILKFILMRYKKASRTLSQFDVHLCNHHGNDAKNNDCCFRAATYSTENNRTFLVQMEYPEKNLVKVYEEAFHSDIEHLSKTHKRNDDKKDRVNTM